MCVYGFEDDDLKCFPKHKTIILIDKKSPLLNTYISVREGKGNGLWMMMEHALIMNHIYI